MIESKAMSDKAATVIRQSQGEDDSISLEMQREKVNALANELADEVTAFDLGVHTGFSILSKDADEQRIDANPKMKHLLEELREGEYEFVCAWDDTRIARDGFFETVKIAAKTGGAEFRFVDDVEDIGSLGHDVQRTVEKHVKQNEIEKAKQAVEARREKGCYEGRPPFGLEYDREKCHLEPDPDEWENVVDIFDLRSDGAPFREISEETEVPIGTISRTLDRRELYERYSDIDLPAIPA